MFNKKLGQYFLTNTDGIKRIISALDLKTKDTILEIGPGKGVLTYPILKNCSELKCKVIAIEKDKYLAGNLLTKIKNYENNIEIIDGDALKLLPSIINKLPFPSKNYKLVGNIPYYITGRLLRILSELENKPELTILTIQKEVAERITSKPPKMNLLAAIVQFWSEPTIIQSLKPEDFMPKPKINSAIIKIVRTPDYEKEITAENYYKFIKILFKQPRKTIFNNLRSKLQINTEKILKILENNNIEEKERPQNLTINMLIKLANAYTKKDVL